VRQSPVAEMTHLKELPAMLRRHFSRAQVEGIMGGNWLEFLGRSLPEE
jgi:microsomal dipeptidase-like Zn-dependent dipeptidase